MSSATVTQRGGLDMQVCVPKNWSDEQVIHFANLANPCGTSKGWMIRKEGDPALSGDPERKQCEEIDRAENVHIMLDA
jgi:hypothetical protein